MNPYILLLKVAAVLALLAGAVFAWNHHEDGVRADGYKAGAARVQGEWNADKAKRTQDALEAVQAARTDEQAKARAANEGERHAREQAEARAAAATAAARRAASAAGGLSGDIAALDRAARALDLSSAAACPGELGRQRDAAIRARAVLGACQQEYRDLAAAADDALGTLNLRLDTALGYIRAVAPTP